MNNSKTWVVDDEARQELANGFVAVADLVGRTAGPGGRTIAIKQPWGPPKVTKDGVTVAKSVNLKGYNGEGVKMIIQASEKTARDAGDGTTATCVLSKEIAIEGLRFISKGSKSTNIKKGIDLMTAEVVEYIKSKSRPITTNEEIKNVATISANGDEEIGNMIGLAIEKIGDKGIITAEEGRGLTTELEIVEGLQFDQGYLSPYFMTHPEKQLVEYDNPLIFMYDGKINNLQSILPLLEKVAEQGRPLLFIVDDINDDALAALVVNKLKGLLNTCVVKAPSFGDIRKFILEDMAVLTGGKLISESLGMKLENIPTDSLGSCSKIKITPTETVLIGGQGSQEDIKERIEQLNTEIETVESAYDKEKIRERLAKLTGGVAIIKVGGATEVEVKEKKDRVDDAICSTRAAIEEGILPGGGISLVRASQELESKIEDKNSDVGIGQAILLKALVSPLKKIVNNTDVNGELIVEQVKNNEFSYGYNARTNEFVDLFEKGIVDATKVVRCSLENASSVAGTLLTIDGIIIEDEKDKDKLPQQPQFM